MKYAVISDVHGNISALTAILKDADNFNIDKYIFVGDYCSYLPYPNEVVDTIKNLENAVIIRGNEDDRLSEYANQSQSAWTDGQFQAAYWCYRTVNSENRNYLSLLPQMITLKDNDMNITVTHMSSDIYGDIEYKEFSSSKVAEKYRNDRDYSREKLLYDIRKYINSDIFGSIVQTLADGIYIFGHTHIQWYAQHKNKIFINPGSCGLALDGIPGAPYTLLHIEKNQIHITERRVPYDADDLISGFKSSGLFEAAPVWSSIILEEMTSGFERILFFLQFVNDYANKINDPIRPFSVKTWTEAYNLWPYKQNVMLHNIK